MYRLLSNVWHLQDNRRNRMRHSAPHLLVWAHRRYHCWSWLPDSGRKWWKSVSWAQDWWGNWNKTLVNAILLYSNCQPFWCPSVRTAPTEDMLYSYALFPASKHSLKTLLLRVQTLTSLFHWYINVCLFSLANHGFSSRHQEILEIHIRHYEPPKCIVDGRLHYELVTIL